MCTYSPESQIIPWAALRCGQQVKRGGSPPQLCSCETLPGVVHPALESVLQDRHGPVGAGPEEGRENDPRAGTPRL